MRQLLSAIAVLIGIGAGVVQAEASVQEDMVCIEPDIEFPVPCEDDD